MLLDELITVIETLKQRITDHGAILQDNETRSRMALIDPLLQVLGWDTTDPFLVIPEYDAGGGQVDYALLDKKGGPTAVIEAKRLGEPLQKNMGSDDPLRHGCPHQLRRHYRRRPMGTLRHFSQWRLA